MRTSLCQQCYELLVSEGDTDKAEVESVCVAEDSAMLSCGPSLQKTRKNQNSEFSNLHSYCMEKENYLVDEDGSCV